MDEFFAELRFLEVAVILIDRDLLCLHHVELLALHGRTHDLADWVAAESAELQLPLRRLLHARLYILSYHHLHPRLKGLSS